MELKPLSYNGEVKSLSARDWRMLKLTVKSWRFLPPEGQVEQTEQADGQQQTLPVSQEVGYQRQQHVASGEAQADAQRREDHPDLAGQDLSTLFLSEVR